jgi:DNA-binding phage protein
MQTILSIEEIKNRLRRRTLSVVVKDTGLSKHTIYRLLDGQDVKYSTAQTLSDYLLANP